MGRLKRRHNWKARQQEKNDAVNDKAHETDIKVDIPDASEDKYDSSNPLVLPAKKVKQEKGKNAQLKFVKPLTKAERKKLTKVIESKKRRANREKLLESLQQNQATTEELALLTSTAGMQTKGLKRSRNTEDVAVVNSVKGCKTSQKVNKKQNTPGNIVGFDTSSSDEDDSDEDNEKDAGMVCVEVTAEEETKDVNDDKSEKTPNTELQKSLVKESPVKDAIASNTDRPCVDGGLKLIKPAHYVPVNRLTAIQEARMKLPIAGEEQVIMEAVSENPVVILCGETGSGKTTQVPQFLYEAGYASGSGIIGITEPRRVAAIAMSKRVGEELNLSPKEVSYQIRYEGNVTDETKIKFMTDGVLLKEVQNDFLLNHYSVIIIDEAHERSVYTDILIGLLSRIVPLRNKRGNPLKLIIMSATLRIEDFTENKKLFKVTPPVIKVEARQFPVTVHFSKKTSEDYVSAAYKKVCRIHRELPEGGILVFVTGQQEINVLCKKLQRTFSHSSNSQSTTEDSSEEKKEIRALKKISKKCRATEINLDDYSMQPLTDDTEIEYDGEELECELEDDDDVPTSNTANCQPVHVLPLYSLLSSKDQQKVFKSPPENTRLIVVSTNVAETSLTIPNIKYVVDTGKVKGRFYDKVTGVSAFSIDWTSKASADQRAGRAGRVGPGHCYRLFSSAVFNDEFSQYSLPEICQKPVDDLVLQMKSMNIDKVINFPFPSPPNKTALQAAERRLVQLGALANPVDLKTVRKKDIDQLEGTAKITELGRVMSCFPIGPRYAKMLALGHQHDLLPYIIAIISAITVQEVLIPAHNLQQDGNESQLLKILGIRKAWAGDGNSLKLGDISILLKAVGTSEFVGFDENWCLRHGLRHKAIREIRKLRVQLTNAVNLILPEINLVVDPKMLPPSDEQTMLLRQILLSGLPDHVARKIPSDEICEEDKKTLKNAYHCAELQDAVFIHPESVLFKELPEYVVYQEVIETKKIYMKGMAAIEPEWLVKFAPDLCAITPLNTSPRYDEVSDRMLCPVSATFGRRSWELPSTEIEMPSDLNKYKWFARFLLEGKVVAKFEHFKSHLIASPATILRTLSNLHPRIENLLKALVKEEVCSKEKLLQVWQHKDKHYLEDVMKQWCPENSHNLIAKCWPPV